MSWYLEHLHPDGRVLTRVPVSPTTQCLRIGRALDNDLVLDDEFCAPYHAKLCINQQGDAQLLAVNTINGIVRKGVSQRNLYTVTDAKPYVLGRSRLRVRHSSWALTPERALRQQHDVLLSLVLSFIVAAYMAFELWLSDVGSATPPYINTLSVTLFVLALWSGGYTMYGRLISGENRFFTHLRIACIGFIAFVTVEYLLEYTAYAMHWLWPLRIQFIVNIVLVALLVRAHLRTADSNHWPTLRYAVVLVAAFLMVVPVAQLWVSSQRLTRIDTHSDLFHPMFNWSTPSTLQDVEAGQKQLKHWVDKDKLRIDSPLVDLWFDD